MYGNLKTLLSTATVRRLLITMQHLYETDVVG